MRDLFGIKLVVFGLQFSVIGSQIDEWFGLVIAGLLVSIVGLLTDRADSVQRDRTLP